MPATIPLAETRDPRLSVRVLDTVNADTALAQDVRAGLTAHPKRLVPKYFYDQLGSVLFDRICDTSEYYQMRTEGALLERLSGEIVDATQPRTLIELGSGAARKTRCILDALEQRQRRTLFVPFDVSESMLVQSGEALLERYPWLQIYGLVGDYERHLSELPRGGPRLVVFLGSTIGNLEEDKATAFLSALRENLNPEDYLLLGTDTVKERSVLEAAYNDRQGVTAAFNKNVLSVLNRRLGASFDLADFAHVAFFNERESQIEMHLKALRSHSVEVQRLELSVNFEEGETIRTEISRKFTEERASRLLAKAGLKLVRWMPAEQNRFALSLSKPG